MRAISVTCPHCGARLSVAGQSEEVRCEYCGTDARVQRRSRVLERVQPPPSSGPPRVAVQRRSGAGVGVVVLVVVLIGAGMVFAMARRPGHSEGRSGGSASTSAAVATPDPPEWHGTEAALLVDVNGDGALDAIGRSRRVPDGDRIAVIAIDGATGRVAWETATIGSYSDTYQGFLALAGDLVLYTSPRAEVRAFAVTDGAPRWTAQLDERVARFCDKGDAIVAVGTDDVERVLAKADGKAPVPAEAEPDPDEEHKHRDPNKERAAGQYKMKCLGAPTDQRVDAPDAPSELADQHGLWADALVSGPGGRVLSGTRTKGTHVGTLVALDDDGEARWRAEVPAQPLGAVERAAMNLVVGEREVCGAYYTTSVADRLRVACFAMDGGKRVWDEQIDDSPLSALMISGRTLLISTWGLLEARDLDTGAVRWRFGR
jgi:outer membrane protein assembly factor BamB